MLAKSNEEFGKKFNRNSDAFDPAPLTPQRQFERQKLGRFRPRGFYDSRNSDLLGQNSDLLGQNIDLSDAKLGAAQLVSAFLLARHWRNDLPSFPTTGA